MVRSHLQREIVVIVPQAFSWVNYHGLSVVLLDEGAVSFCRLQAFLSHPTHTATAIMAFHSKGHHRNQDYRIQLGSLLEFMGCRLPMAGLLHQQGTGISMLQNPPRHGLLVEHLLYILQITVQRYVSKGNKEAFCPWCYRNPSYLALLTDLLTRSSRLATENHSIPTRYSCKYCIMSTINSNACWFKPWSE